MTTRMVLARLLDAAGGALARMGAGLISKGCDLNPQPPTPADNAAVRRILASCTRYQPTATDQDAVKLVEQFGRPIYQFHPPVPHGTKSKLGVSHVLDTLWTAPRRPS